MTGTTDLHELGKDETGGSGTDQEDLGTEGHLEFVHSVNGARSGLEKGGLLVGKVLDLVALGEVAEAMSAIQCCLALAMVNYVLLDVVGETTVSSDTSGGEVLAEELLTSSAVVAVATGLCLISLIPG